MNFRSHILPSIFISWVRKPNPEKCNGLFHIRAEPGHRALGPQWLTHISRWMAVCSAQNGEHADPQSSEPQCPANAEGLSAGILEPSTLHPPPHPQPTWKSDPLVGETTRTETMSPWRRVGKSLLRRDRPAPRRQMRWNKDARTFLLRSGKAQGGVSHRCYSSIEELKLLLFCSRIRQKMSGSSGQWWPTENLLVQSKGFTQGAHMITIWMGQSTKRQTWARKN